MSSAADRVRSRYSGRGRRLRDATALPRSARVSTFVPDRKFFCDAPSTKFDPTGTTRLRQRFEADLVRRIRRIRSAIWQAVAIDDVLGLQPTRDVSKIVQSAMFAKLFASAPARVQDAYDPNQPRDPGGEGGGQWIREGGGVSRVLKKATQGHGLSAARLTETERSTLISWLSSQSRSSVPVHRGVWLTNKQFSSGSWNEGERVQFRALESFTEDPVRTSAYGSGGDIFVRLDMPAGHTVDIAKHSVYPQEQEHVLPSAVSMKISSRIRQSPGFFIIKLSPVTTDAAPSPKQFAFERPSDKVQSFMNWIDEMIDEEILEIVPGTRVQSASQRAWQNVYLDTAYQKGMRDAARKIGAGYVGAAFNSPVHADRVGLVYTRAYRDLEGITDAMDQGISRVLAQAMAEGRGLGPGLGPGSYDLARLLTKQVDGIGIVRARTLVRTEIIGAHAEATLNSYEEAGIVGVSVEAEFTTAGDNKVCEQCRGLEGKVFSIEDARGVIPVHPRCRCAWNPVV